MFEWTIIVSLVVVVCVLYCHIVKMTEANPNLSKIVTLALRNREALAPMPPWPPPSTDTTTIEDWDR